MDACIQSSRPEWRFKSVCVALAVAFGGFAWGVADATDNARYRDLCDDVPQDIPEDGDYTKLPADNRDWHKRIEACNALLAGDNPDPDIYYYAGRLEFKELNFSRARLRFRQGAAAGSVKAMTALGISLANSDRKGMLKWFHEAAEEGDPMAQTELGFIYAGLTPWSKGVELDHRQARQLLEAAAAQGDPVAHLVLGTMAWPDDENGNKEALEDALERIRTAARTGLPEAREMLRDEGYPVPAAKIDPRWPPTAVPLHRILRRP